MARIIAIINEKGGVGKTTAALEQAYLSGKRGLKVLLIDSDSQANATKMLATEESSEEMGLFDLLTDAKGKVPIWEVIQPANEAWPNCLFIAGDNRLAGAPRHLSDRLSKEKILRKLLEGVQNDFDVIYIDLGPTLNILHTNALVAATHYQIPTDLDAFGMAGIEAIQGLASEIIKEGLNPGLKFAGVFGARCHKAGAKVFQANRQTLKGKYGKDLIEIWIPDSCRVSESHKLRLPIGVVDPESATSSAYQALERVTTKGLKV